MAVGVIAGDDKDVNIGVEGAGEGESGVGFGIADELPFEADAAIWSAISVDVDKELLSGEETGLTLCDFVDSTFECSISEDDCSGKSCFALFTNI